MFYIVYMFEFVIQIINFLTISILNNSQEPDKEVDDSKESRDAKSRYVLRRLKNLQTPFRKNGKIFCPFCEASVHQELESMIQHATGVGRGGKRHSAVAKAKHAAYGVFLRDYVRTGRVPNFNN